MAILMENCAEQAVSYGLAVRDMPRAKLMKMNLWIIFRGGKTAI